MPYARAEIGEKRKKGDIEMDITEKLNTFVNYFKAKPEEPKKETQLTLDNTNNKRGVESG